MANEETKMEIGLCPFRDTSTDEDMDWQPSHQMAASSALGPQNGITISLSKSDPAHSNQTILTVLRECTEIRAHIELSEVSKKTHKQTNKQTYIVLAETATIATKIL
ncbi:uncharacterized protein LOC110042826 isoform X2 [Orbicella faveolata]|nr:uncharacterized protein LOC110042826 isoform X2 [Orbicella faveolata]